MKNKFITEVDIERLPKAFISGCFIYLGQINY